MIRWLTKRTWSRLDGVLLCGIAIQIGAQNWIAAAVLGVVGALVSSILEVIAEAQTHDRH